jgi:DNA primase
MGGGAGGAPFEGSISLFKHKRAVTNRVAYNEFVMDAVEEVKSRINIEDVISEYVQLKRAGRNFKGLSPFGNEKTPSFMVSPEKQIWHDFSSGKGGNVFSFIMEMEGLDFKAALEHLARKAGVDLTQYQTGKSAQTGKLKERLYEATEMAAKFYQVQFSKNQKALEYIFKKRQFTKDIVLAFRIGYSPNNGSALCDYLKKQGYSDQELQSAGLMARRYRGGDMFRGRIMIPLQDPQGKVIGFTARLLDDDPEAPKYINTPQTLLYDKGRHVYGLHLAKETIRTKKYAVLVEGNLDVIASHQAGVKEVVATAGTALTEMHLKALGRFTNDLRLAFDQDKAGLAATERAIPIAGKVGVSLSIITVPEGKDPDELVRKTPDAWATVIEQNQYALDWLIDRYKKQLDLETAQGKREFSDIMLGVVRQLPDHVEQDHYLNKLAKLLGVSAEALKSKLNDKPPVVRVLKKNKSAPMVVDKMQLDAARVQDHLLALFLMQPALRHYMQSIQDDMLTNENALKVLRFLRKHPDFAGNPKEAAGLKEVGDYVKILGLQFEELYQDLELLELRNEATRLQAKLIDIYVKMKKQPIIEALRESEEPERTRLLEQAKALDQLLKNH